jgi:hypothetical protein
MINEPPPARPVERNPVTYQKHRHEVLWQITVPLVVGAILILIPVVLVILASVTGVSQLNKLAQVSLIWLIIIGMVISLLVIIFTVTMIYAATAVLRTTSPVARQIQDTFLLIRLRVNQYADKAVEPILRYQSFMASMGALGRGFRKKRGSN